MTISVEQKVYAASRPIAYWQLQPISKLDGERCRIGGIEFCSQDLCRTLTGCRHAFFFIGTLGAEVDRLIRRLGVTSVAQQLEADRIANQIIERYCDECEKQMLVEVPGERLRMRYAPGYGDLELKAQIQLLSAVDATRRVGVSLSDSLMMMPTKTISAIIGAGE